MSNRRAMSLSNPVSSPLSLRACATPIACSSTLKIDREAGIIRNVSIITAGAALGHDFIIDETTVDQVAKAINANPNGIPARLTHAELGGVDPIRVMAGKFRNAGVERNDVGNRRAIADFHIGKYAQHSPEGNLAEYLLGLAEDAPEAVGTSIHTLDFEIVDGVLRVNSLDNIDWVGSPAANPAGMLSSPSTSQTSSGGALPSAQSPSATKGDSTMNLSAKQMAYLQSIGLAAGATEQQVADFVAALSNDQKAAYEAAAIDTPAAPTPVAASAKPAAPAVSLAAPRTVDHAQLSELNDLAVLSDLGGDWAMKMALDGVSLADARKIALAEKAKGRKPIPMAGSGVQVGDDLNLGTLTQAVSDALALKAGNGYEVPEFDGNKRPVMLSRGAEGGKIKMRAPHDRANQFRHLSLCDMGRQFLVAQGYREAAYLSKPQLASLLLNRHKLRDHCQRIGINLAMGTTDFSSLLADSMGKTLRQAYVVQPATWPLWARKATAPDFKTQRRVQLSEAPTLTSIAEGQEYTFGSVSDAGETYTLTKYGTGLIFTWQSMVNDDTDAFSRLPVLMGRAAARIVETTAIGVLTTNANMADSVALFATAHGNLSTGTPSVASLGEARAKMRMQTPLGGTSAQALGTMPRTVLCPEELAITFGQLIGSQVDPAKSNATPNPFMNVLNVASSPLLSSTSAIVWYLLADPNDIDTVDVCFLEGEEGPVVEEEIDFSSDDMKIKVRQTCTAKATDWRGMVKSSGA